MAAEAILVSGATEILKGLSILLASEIALAWGVNDELQDLKETLDMIQNLMVDAEKKQVKSKAVRLWLQELKDLVYEAEDILDEHAYEVIRQQQEMSRKRDKVRNFFSSSNPIVFHRKIAHEIKVVNEKFNEIAKRKESLGLQIIELGTPSRTTNLDEISKLRETDSTLDLSLKIIGRDNDKSNIIHMLFQNDSHNQGVNPQVIPIVGMGGLGKTTLAQLIYDDDKVKSHFELKMWVCVSADFDVKKIFVTIIESITNDKCDDVSNIDVLTRQLQRHLSGKKYLLVLDDVWNKKREAWVNFRKHLLVGADGSKIIVTTRSDDVASIMGGKPYKLGILDDEESWSLFHKQTFEHSGGQPETPTLVAIGKELVKKCEGLPLALIFLIGLLRNKDENEWRVINKYKFQSYSEDDESRILSILKLSYDHLPSYLKQCFSYFSLFPKDFSFNLPTIISLWMAEGFLPQPSGGNNMSMEEVGNTYFKILLSNSFIQDVERDEFGQVLSFKMHDLIHDLATYVVDNRECFVLHTDERMADIPSVRRLQLIGFEKEFNFNETMAVVLKNNPKLRTLLVGDAYIKKIENNAFDGMKRLRVLDLSWSLGIEELSMSTLKHLRYLDLSYSKITKLPKSVTKLFHLQTLKLEGCKNLKELPKGIGQLINLRHLLLPEDINLPREIGQLSSLQTLEPINGKGNGGGGSCGIEVLEILNLLNGDLTINQLGYVRSGIEAQRANLIGKKNLNKIFLNWHTNPVGDDAAARSDDCEYDKDEVVLEALQPHPNLKTLCIDQYFGVKLPRWMGDLQNLVHLKLRDCNRCKQLPALGVLPSLRFLEMYRMMHLEEWLDEPLPLSIVFSSYPSLEIISISGCPKLKSMPTKFFSLKEFDVRRTSNGMGVSSIVRSNLDTLTVLYIWGVDGLEFLPLVGLLKDNNVLQSLTIGNCPEFKGFNREEEEGDEDLLLLSSSSSSLHTLELDNCPVLRFLPDLKDLTSLQNVTIQGCYEDLVISLPNGVENRKFKFVRLEKFKVLSNTVEDIAESEGLTSLEGERENLESVEVRKNADKANFKRPQNIKRVALTWSDETILDEDDESSNDSLVLEGLRPHPSLRCEQLPALGNLPFLRLLIVRGMIAIKRLGREFYYGGGEGSILLSEEEAANTTIAFPSLNELVLDDMPNLEEWVESLQPKLPLSTSASSFPLLESIEIKLCPKLKSIPTLFPSLSNLEFYSSNGTSLSSVMKSNLGSLVSLYIEEVPRLVFLPRGLLTNNNVLQSLDIYDCPDFQGFIHQGEKRELFNSNSSSLQFLTILDCPGLTFLPGIRGMTSLQRLTILDCNKELDILPNDLECLPSLEEFEFGFSHPNEIEEAEE